MKVALIGATARHPLHCGVANPDDDMEWKSHCASGPEPEATIDEQDELGVLPNWDSHYGYEEQIARFEAYSTRPDLLRALYALEAPSGKGTLFTPDWIANAKDTEISVDSVARSMFRPGRVIVGVDPARASGPRASWFVIVPVLFVSATGTEPEQRVVLDLIHERGVGSVEAQGAMVKRIADAWKAEWCAIEAVAGYGYLAAYCEHTLRLPVRSIVTTKADADEIPSLADEVARRRWRIPWGDVRSQRVMGPLVNEMHDYGNAGAARDCLMALTFARRAMYETPEKKSGTPSIRTLYP